MTLAASLDAIDAANAADPNVVTVGDRRGPKEVVHAQMVYEWVRRLRPDAGDALLLAARGHHFRRWTSPRSSQPAGRAGYLRWRKALSDQQARELGAMLRECGHDEAVVARAEALVSKRALAAGDTDAQVLEDAICLVFLETQFADVAMRLEPATLDRVVVKTVAKMSDNGRAHVSEVPLTAQSRRLLDGAIASDVVRRYLGALAAPDWDALRATLAADVHRIGPYGDVFDGRDPYAEYLEATIASLSGYVLAVDRVLVDGRRVAVELSETVDDGEDRLHTDEVVVFDTAVGEITRIAVYLRSSTRERGA